MITSKQLDLLGVQFHLLHDTIRSIIYYRIIVESKDKKVPWGYITDVLSDHLTQSWCKIFGSTKQDTHWKKLAEKDEVKNLVTPYSMQSILKATSLSSDEWKDYHKNILILRDKFFAHYDMKIVPLHFPNLDAALRAAISYREWLSGLLNVVAERSITHGTIINKNALSTEDMLKQFSDEANTLCCYPLVSSLNHDNDHEVSPFET